MKLLIGDNTNKGEEKEIELNENITTAEYWEYDSRTVRRWNLDPKPTVGISEYSVFNGNPIWHSDPLGDTAVISINKTTEIRYVGGSWINSTTRAAVNTTGLKKDIVRLMNDYNTLNSISDYSPVTNEINSNASLVKLNWNGGPKTGASETNSLKYLQDLSAGIAHPDVDVYNTGRDNLDPSIYEKGKNNAPTYVGLGHELGHVWDLLTTNPMSVKIFHFTQAAGVVTPNISYSEKNAMYWENVLRAHGNLPLRTYYNYDATNGFEYPANITIVKSVPIFNGGKKPIANLQTITLTNLDGTQTHTFTRTK